MLAIAYLLVCLFFGVQMLHFLFPDPQRLFIGIAPRKNSLTLVPMILFYYPAGFIIGLILVTFLTYWVALIMTPFVPREMPVLYPANVVSLCLAIYLGSIFWQKCFLRKYPPAPEIKPDVIPERRRLGGRSQQAENLQSSRLQPLAPGFIPTKGSVIFYIVSILFFITAAAALFYYSYHVTSGILCAGYSVFSDLAPHTALISSFSQGSNFPTVYPHFPADGIRYHFLFYFLCGNLNLLGLRIDNALNIPSILVMVCCFLLLGVLAVLLSGKRAAFLLAPVLVLFRSSFAFISQIRTLAQVPGASLSTIINGILSNREWIGNTPKDSWGLWAINVYANQRHLLLGVSLLLILIILFIPHVRRMFLHVKKAGSTQDKIRQFLFCREAWLPRKNDPLHPYNLAIVALLIVIAMPYFHGSALIAALLILFVMAIFSENRVTYAVIAAAAFLSATLQAQYFSGGTSNVVSFSYYWGFLTENPTLLNVLIYIGEMMGIASVLVLILLFTQKNAFRTVLLIAFGVPFVFAFFFSMTIDITANHKFIQISLILFSIYLAALLTFLWKPFSNKNKAKKSSYNADADVQSMPRRISPARGRLLSLGSRILAVILFISLTATGVNEWIVFYNLNKNSIMMNMTSPMVAWIEANTEKNAIFLTAPYAMNTFFLSGRYAYYGHPYYAWSAGYDTEARMAIYADLLTGCGGDFNKFRTTCLQQNISYFLVDDDLRNQKDFPVNEEFFKTSMIEAATFAENNTIIYKVV